MAQAETYPPAGHGWWRKPADGARLGKQWERRWDREIGQVWDRQGASQHGFEGRYQSERTVRKPLYNLLKRWLKSIFIEALLCAR